MSSSGYRSGKRARAKYLNCYGAGGALRSRAVPLFKLCSRAFFGYTGQNSFRFSCNLFAFNLERVTLRTIFYARLCGRGEQPAGKRCGYSYLAGGFRARAGKGGQGVECTRVCSACVLQRARANVAETGRECARVEQVWQEPMGAPIVQISKVRPHRLRRRSLNLAKPKTPTLRFKQSGERKRKDKRKAPPQRHESARERSLIATVQLSAVRVPKRWRTPSRTVFINWRRA